MTAPMLHAFRYGPGGVEETRPETLASTRALVEPGRVVWVNVNRTDHAEVISSLARDFGIHPLTLEDVQHTAQRPKVEDYPGYLYVVTRMMKRTPDDELDTEQVSILVGDGWLITIQEGKPGDVFEAVRERIRQGSPVVTAGGVDTLMYHILDAVVDAYFPMIARLGERAERIEEEVLDRPKPDVRERLQSLRRDLLTVKRVAWPQRDALLVLERADLRWVKPGTRTFLRDVTDHAMRVIDFVEMNREIIASLMELHMTSVAQRTNEAMRVLTVVATIFIPLTFVAGVYGMNFRHMPELDSPWGYPAVLLLMAVMGIGMFAHFKRRGWV